MGRVAVLDRDICKPQDCGISCVKFCPKVRSRVETIRIDEADGKPIITETLCTGCGICIKKCPFKAISIVNIPEELEEQCSHRYGQNQFKLYRLPTPQLGAVTGLLGRNGTGKTTALRILSGEIKPNLGNFIKPPDWPTIIRNFRGSTLQAYFEGLSNGRLKVHVKPQYVDRIPALAEGMKVKDLLIEADEKGEVKRVVEEMQLHEVLDRPVNVLSGGELQRVALASTVCREADIYIFDEPSSHLDVYQRIKVSKVIRELVDEDVAIIVAEHDLAMLDYLSDRICLIYGEPGVYGIVSHVHGLGPGLNTYLNGFIADENMRFRPEPIRFHFKPPREVKADSGLKLVWGETTIDRGSFTLNVEPGEINQGEVVGILGPNGIGKTTFIRFLAGIDGGSESPISGCTVSYKPQYISTEYQGDVKTLLSETSTYTFKPERFEAEIVRPLGLTKILDRNIKDLSGGELQRVAVAACLSRKAQVYLLDEPSAYLDVEERLAVARVIRRIAEEQKSFIFVVEHDIVAQDFIADRLMVFQGEPGVYGVAGKPLPLRDGMNMFLSTMDLTFRRDPETGRPRVNKSGSKLDRAQKDMGEYYYVPATSQE
ncbi:MAG: ribosome biogenesis/translation initiation ATPase RLI [Candidatus Bathyarchaeia archaeon]